MAWLILSSDLSQGVSQVEMQSAPCVCISEKVSTDRTQTLLPCLLAMPLTKESQRTSLAAKTEISLGSVASTALTTLHLPMYSMWQHTDLAQLYLSCTVLILQSPHKKNKIQLLSRQMQSSTSMCKCKGTIGLFIVCIAFPDAHCTFIVGVNSLTPFGPSVSYTASQC